MIHDLRRDAWPPVPLEDDIDPVTDDPEDDDPVTDPAAEPEEGAGE